MGKKNIKPHQFCHEHKKTNHMATSIITPDDLEQFKWELLDQIKQILDKKVDKPISQEEKRVWIKSHQVQRLLGISPGTLQNLRINGTLPYTKVGGVLFYNKEDIEKILENNMRNADQSNLMSNL